MTNANMTNTVGILGAGTMGAGIAQVATIAGWNVLLHDLNEDAVHNAIETINGRLNRLVEKGRLTEAVRDEASARLQQANGPGDFSSSDLVIEAIVEDLGVKTNALQAIIPKLKGDAIIATNTSSLSITKIGRSIGEPHRTVGMHFFNPAPLMKLVEVVAGDETDRAVVDRTASIAESWGKTVARAADVPGFIVNHVARPYYLEAFRIVENGYATVDEIDDTMQSIGGFRMGPFALTDLIGQDVNTATTRSVWEQLDKPPLLHPSRLQEQLVSDGHLGRKTGRGAYDYSDEKPQPSINIERRPLDVSEDLQRAIQTFTQRAVEQPGSESQNYTFARVLCALIVQAHLAAERGVADPDNIDIALKYGVNYPQGPFEWTRAIGPDAVAQLLEALNATVDDGRFACPAISATASAR